MCRVLLMQMSVAVLWTALLCISTFPTGHGKKGEDGKCSHNAVVLAMTTCQGERHKLSLASQSNDTVKLCGALQQYSACMTPRIEGCKGPAKMAFDVITGKYASQPYNCKIDRGGGNILNSRGLGDEPYQGHSPSGTMGDHHFEDADEDITEGHAHQDDDDDAIDNEEATDDAFSRHPPITHADVDEDDILSPDPSSETKPVPVLSFIPTFSSTKQADEESNRTLPAATTPTPAFNPSDTDNGTSPNVSKSSLLSQLIVSVSIHIMLYVSMPM